MRLEENSGTDKPKVEEPIQKPVEEVMPEKSAKPEKMKASKFQSIVNKVTLVLVSLVIGALAIILALYLPALTKLNKAEKEMERLAGIEAQYTELQANFSKVKEQSSVYKTISDTSLLETALTINDTTKVNQQLRYVEEDLKAMQIADFPEILQRLQSQFLKIKSAASGNQPKALEELGKFYNDLLLLADNLE
jgi:protein subunit release factor A